MISVLVALELLDASEQLHHNSLSSYWLDGLVVIATLATLLPETDNYLSASSDFAFQIFYFLAESFVNFDKFLNVFDGMENSCVSSSSEVVTYLSV